MSEKPEEGDQYSGKASLLPQSSQSFPIKLYQLLENSGRYGDLLRWRTHGCAFEIVNTKRLVTDLLPVAFDQRKFTSFQRQLNIYGFRKIPKGPDKNCYFHPSFQRNRPELLAEIRRVPVKAKEPAMNFGTTVPYFSAMEEDPLSTSEDTDDIHHQEDVYTFSSPPESTRELSTEPYFPSNRESNSLGMNTFSQTAVPFSLGISTAASAATATATSSSIPRTVRPNLIAKHAAIVAEQFSNLYPSLLTEPSTSTARSQSMEIPREPRHYGEFMGSIAPAFIPPASLVYPLQLPTPPNYFIGYDYYPNHPYAYDPFYAMSAIYPYDMTTQIALSEQDDGKDGKGDHHSEPSRNPVSSSTRFHGASDSDSESEPEPSKSGQEVQKSDANVVTRTRPRRSNSSKK